MALRSQADLSARPIAHGILVYCVYISLEGCPVPLYGRRRCADDGTRAECTSGSLAPMRSQSRCDFKLPCDMHSLGCTIQLHCHDVSVFLFISAMCTGWAVPYTHVVGKLVRADRGCVVCAARGGGCCRWRGRCGSRSEEPRRPQILV